MKLRLPHKLQAALIATLAAAALTTLSTGATAQAWTAQTSTTSEYVSTAESYTQHGWNYNASTGVITAPGGIWDNFNYELSVSKLAEGAANTGIVYVTSTAGNKWGLAAGKNGDTKTGLGGVWGTNAAWGASNNFFKSQEDVAALDTDHDGLITMSAKINNSGTNIYSQEDVQGTAFMASTGLKDSVNAVTSLTIDKNYITKFRADYTSAEVTWEDGTVKDYAWAYEQASGRSATMKTDTGYNAYIVRSGAEAWFASGTGTVNIAGDLYVAGTYSDGYGALRLGTDANGVLNLNGGLYLGANSVISADSEGDSKRGTINFNGDVVGSDYTLTFVTPRNMGSSVVFNNNVDLGGLVSAASLSFGSDAVATVGDVTFTTANRTYANGGNLTIDGTATLGTAFTNTGDLTLNGTATLGGVLTNTGTLTLNGTVALGSGLSIVNNTDGVVDLLNGVVFDLTNVQAETSGDTKTYTLFTGSKNVDLTSLNGATVTDHITGTTAAGHTWAFTSDGKLVSTVASRNLMWSLMGEPGVWTSKDDNVTPWVATDVFPLATTYFHNGDSVTFMEFEDIQATLGSDVEALKMTLEETPDVTINNGGTYSLHVETLDIKSGHLTTNTQMTVENVSIAAGAEWALGGTLDVDALASYTNSGTLHVLNGGQVNAHKGTDTGSVTADAGGTLYVDNGSGQGDAKYTYHGSADAPFKGTLVYDILSSGNHDVSIALENFQGTLELRGRLAASASSFGGMTRLVLNGDRSSNTTGLWNQNAFTLNVPVDIVGNHTVDLYTSNAMTINGAVNGDGVKRGHLGKQNTGALTFNGAVTLLDFTTAGGSVTFNAGATMDAMTINGGTVTLNGGGSLGNMHLAGGSASVTLGGADKDYSFTSVKISSGNLSVAESGVNSLTAGDLVVRTTSTLSSAAADPTVFNVTNFDVSNYNTNFTLRNVTLNVSGAATAAVLNTAQENDQATVTVDNKATLNLNGTVVWNKNDTAKSKTDYVNLVIANGGTANVNAGAANILNNVTVNAGGALSFGADTTTTVAGTLALADTITNAGTVTINGGSVAAGQAGTLTGSGTYNLNGTITNNGTLQLADATLNGAAGAAITGNVAIHGGLFSGSLAIGSPGSTISVTKAFTVADGISLNLGGTDALVLDNLEGTVATYSDGVVDPTNNGFLAYLTGTVFHYLGDDEPFQDVTLPLHVTYHGNAGMINYDTDKKTAEFAIGGSKATFYVNTATETEETYSHAKEVGADTFTMVELANGTGFNIDSANAALSRVTVKAGAAASLTIGGTGATIGSVETGAELTLTGEGSLTLGNAGGDHSLNGAGTLTINGPTVTINGTNNASFTGNIDVLAGTLKLGDSTSEKYVLGAYNYTAGDTRTITIHTGATLDINGKADANYVLTLDGGRFTNNSNTDVAVGSSQVVGLKLTANSYVGDSGHGSEFWLRERTNKPAPILELNQYNLTKQGTGVFGLHSTTVTGTGYLVVEEGTVKFDGGSFGANFRLEGGAAASGQAGAVTGTVNLTADTTIDTTAASTFAAVITGTGKSVTKTGEGTLTLTGANTYTGGTTISAGTLVADNAGALGTGAVTIAQGGNLVINAAMSNHTANSFNNNGGVLTMQNGSSLTMQVTGGTKTFNLGNVVVNGSAGIAANTSTACYNALFNMTSLSSGSDGAEIVLATGAQYSKATVFDLDTNQTAAFNGTITVKQNNTSTSAGRPVALNLTIGEDAKAAEILKGSVIKLDSAGNAKALVGLGLNSDVTVKGIDSGTAAAQQHAIFAGKATTDTEAFKSSGDARTLTIDTAGTDHSTHADVLDKINLVKKGAGTQVFSGDMSNFNGSVEVEGGVLHIMNAASVNVTDVTISNSTLGVYSGATATAETDSEGTLTIKQDKALTASGNATLNANLVMETGATLDVTGTSGAGLALGSSVTLNTGMTLNDYGSEWSTWEDGATYTLFTGVDGLNIGSDLGTAAIDYTQWVDAQQYFENIQESNRYFLCYGGAPAQNAETLLTGVGANGSNVGMVYIMVMPEPTTGTLSLLALCALAARRRRK